MPLPKLPGNANQTPTREQDQFFTALVDWVEKGEAPGEIVLTSRDNEHQLPRVRLSAADDMERPRTGDAGHKFQPASRAFSSEVDTSLTRNTRVAPRGTRA